MKYDFDTVVNRRNTGSYKWDVKEDELPMWVADMDFVAAPEILEALSKKLSEGVFGYSVLPDEWAMAYTDWWKKRHSLDIDREWLVFCTGVVPAISTAVRKLTTPAEKVLIQTPVYNIFFNSIINNGRFVVENPLKRVGDSFEMDFEDLETKLSDPQTSLMILCNPQNPVGKIWSRDVLKRVGELCAKYHVTVISDEIHCDLTDPGCEYVPFASVSEECAQISVTCMAPTKAFNIAGIQSAAVMIPNENLRHKMWRGLNTDEVAEPNAFAVAATVAAFTKGGQWLDELRMYICENKKSVKEFIEQNISGITVIPSDATYLLWLDCTQLCERVAKSKNGEVDTDEITRKIRESTGLYLSAGRQFGECGKYFIRMNIACPRVVLTDGLRRLQTGVRTLLGEK